MPKQLASLLSYTRYMETPNQTILKQHSPQHYPFPQALPAFGPASQIINSAATASKIDQTTAQPQVPTNQFKVGDTIFLTYSVHPKSPGTVTARWYTNNNYFQISTSTPIKDASSGYFPMQYLQPAEGKVELYWNGQLAVTLFFVVEPGQPWLICIVALAGLITLSIDAYITKNLNLACKTDIWIFLRSLRNQNFS